MGQIPSDQSDQEDDPDYDPDNDDSFFEELFGRKRRKASSPPFVPNKKRKLQCGTNVNVESKVASLRPHAHCKLRLMKLERIKDHLLLEEEFLRNVQTTLISNVSSEMKELEHLRGKSLRVVMLDEMIDNDHAVVSSIFGETYMPVLSFVDRNLIEPGCSALTNFNMGAVVGLLPDEREMALAKLKLEKPPTESFEDIGGLESQIEELREGVELPLTRPDLYEEMGITAPKGILLYGPPGTGKTLLAKAVANRTSATFLRISGSELVEKHSGEGPKKVRDMFRLAREKSPAIIFIDEVDAIGMKRTDGASEGELEVQRTMLELLTQLDGFDERGNVKVIMATNRIDSLDPALIRPGRIDRKVEIPLPSVEVLAQIFQIHTRRMSLSDDVVAEDYLLACDGLSGADVGAMCTEAGLIALRSRRRMVCAEDFAQSKINVVYRKKNLTPKGMYL